MKNLNTINKCILQLMQTFNLPDRCTSLAHFNFFNKTSSLLGWFVFRFVIHIGLISMFLSILLLIVKELIYESEHILSY